VQSEDGGDLHTRIGILASLPDRTQRIAVAQHSHRHTSGEPNRGGFKEELNERKPVKDER
jgi:hypothetical protein